MRVSINWYWSPSENQQQNGTASEPSTIPEVHTVHFRCIQHVFCRFLAEISHLTTKSIPRHVYWPKLSVNLKHYDLHWTDSTRKRDNWRKYWKVCPLRPNLFGIVLFKSLFFCLITSTIYMVIKWQHSFVWISSQIDAIEGKCPTLLPVLNSCLQMAALKYIHIRGL